MQKIISKIRNKGLKGNISLLVILILLASSVIALLSISQIQHLITYWDMTFNYFRAFYLAKAGTELGLTEVYNRENWFEDKIENIENEEDGSINFNPIISGNFMWKDNKYEWANPYFNMTITWNFKVLTDDIRYECKDENKITLQPRDEKKPGEWIMLSLFRDNTKDLSNILNSEYTKGIIPLENSEIQNLTFGNPGWSFMFWLFAYDNKWEEMTNIIVEKWSSLSTFLNNNIWKISWTRRYLTIKNIWDKPVSFCISWNDRIPYSNYLVTVRGNYADMEVWLQSVVKKKIPSWSLDVLWWDS